MKMTEESYVGRAVKNKNQLHNETGRRVDSRNALDCSFRKILSCHPLYKI
jgi:hypothetical protein